MMQEPLADRSKNISMYSMCVFQCFCIPIFVGTDLNFRVRTILDFFRRCLRFGLRIMFLG